MNNRILWLYILLYFTNINLGFGQKVGLHFKNEMFSIRISNRSSKVLKIRVNNLSSDTLICTPFVKHSRIDPLTRFGCDTIDFATYMLTCNNCQLKYDLSVMHGHCRLFFDMATPKQSRRLLCFLDLKKPHILIFRVFSPQKNIGYKFCIPLKVNKNGAKISYSKIEKFDE